MNAYFRTVAQLVRAPRRFFADPGDAARQPTPVVFLTVSSILSAGAAMALGPQAAGLIQGAILIVNGFGMTLLAATLAYGVMLAVAGTAVSFGRLFGIFAHSAGVTLLLSWNPALLIFTEPWKWWLTWTGMRTSCRLTRGQTALILFMSLGMILILFRALLSMTAP